MVTGFRDDLLVCPPCTTRSAQTRPTRASLLRTDIAALASELPKIASRRPVLEPKLPRLQFAWGKTSLPEQAAWERVFLLRCCDVARWRDIRHNNENKSNRSDCRGARQRLLSRKSWTHGSHDSEPDSAYGHESCDSPFDCHIQDGLSRNDEALPFVHDTMVCSAEYLNFNEMFRLCSVAKLH